MLDADPSLKARALARALDHALAQPGFDPGECRRYMGLAFAEDDGDAYERLIARLDGWGLLGPEEAERLAGEAFFGLRPGILGRIALARPLSVAGRRADGVDVCRAGLALAIVKGDRTSALGLAEAMRGCDGGGARLFQALSEAIELVSDPIGGPWGAPGGQAELELGAARALSAECERAYLSGGVPAGAKRGARAL